jgi:lysophospholipase L1-like esterase
VVVFVGLAGACSGSSNTPSPLPLALVCPIRVNGQTTDAAGVPAQFQVTVQGGRPPVSVVCTPASGSTFPIGPSTVSCTATDAASQTAGCSFPVLVTRIPTLAWTRFLAFGDSITEGVTSPAPNVLRRVGLPDAYPGQLQQMLAARYTAQTITVINRGIAGERLSDGRERLPDVLDEDRPEVLLLLEGVNNIRNVPLEELAEDLDDMVREARRRNVEVLIATLLPISEDREAGRPGTLEVIEDLNDEIFDIARRNRIGDPVDLFSLFSRMPSLLGVDGLHPTAAGYTQMAQVFFETIRARYEVDPSPDPIVVGTEPLVTPGSAGLSTSPTSPPSSGADPSRLPSRSRSIPRTPGGVPRAPRR